MGTAKAVVCGSVLTPAQGKGAIKIGLTKAVKKIAMGRALQEMELKEAAVS